MCIIDESKAREKWNNPRVEDLSITGVGRRQCNAQKRKKETNNDVHNRIERWAFIYHHNLGRLRKAKSFFLLYTWDCQTDSTHMVFSFFFCALFVPQFVANVFSVKRLLKKRMSPPSCFEINPPLTSWFGHFNTRDKVKLKPLSL